MRTLRWKIVREGDPYALPPGFIATTIAIHLGKRTTSSRSGRSSRPTPSGRLSETRRNVMTVFHTSKKCVETCFRMCLKTCQIPVCAMLKNVYMVLDSPVLSLFDHVPPFNVVFLPKIISHSFLCATAIYCIIPPCQEEFSWLPSFSRVRRSPGRLTSLIFLESGACGRSRGSMFRHAPRRCRVMCIPHCSAQA